MDHCGPLTRSAGDIALFLQVIAGFDAEDPGSEDVPVPDYRAALTGRIEGLRFGLIEHWYAEGAHPDLVPTAHLDPISAPFPASSRGCRC